MKLLRTCHLSRNRQSGKTFERIFARWKRHAQDWEGKAVTLASLAYLRACQIFWVENPISFRFTGETSAFFFACDLLQEDLVHLFGDLAYWQRV